MHDAIHLATSADTTFIVLRCSSESKENYQNTFVSEFLKLYPDPFAVPKNTWDTIVKFWYLDLSETDTILAPFYPLS